MCVKGTRKDFRLLKDLGFQRKPGPRASKKAKTVSLFQKFRSEIMKIWSKVYPHVHSRLRNPGSHPAPSFASSVCRRTAQKLGGLGSRLLRLCRGRDEAAFESQSGCRGASRRRLRRFLLGKSMLMLCSFLLLRPLHHVTPCLACLVSDVLLLREYAS